MKFTQYFPAASSQPDRKLIKSEWIQYVTQNPAKEEIQDDGRIRLWAGMAEMNNRFLRVVLLDDGETVHNTFFDRSCME